METLLCNKVWYGRCLDEEDVPKRDRAEMFLSHFTQALDIFFPSHLEIDRFLTLEALRRTGGDQLKTAALLGISERALRYRIVAYRPYWTDLALEAEVTKS